MESLLKNAGQQIGVYILNNIYITKLYIQLNLHTHTYTYTHVHTHPYAYTDTHTDTHTPYNPFTTSYAIKFGGLKMFSPPGSKLWNYLPKKLLLPTITTNMFKRRLKSFLLR